MKLTVLNENKHINIRIPTALMLSRVGMSIYKKLSKSDTGPLGCIDMSMLPNLRRAVKQARRIHPDWVLLEVYEEGKEVLKLKL